jgi:hypothetical protein
MKVTSGIQNQSRRGTGVQPRATLSLWTTRRAVTEHTETAVRIERTSSIVPWFLLEIRIVFRKLSVTFIQEFLAWGPKRCAQIETYSGHSLINHRHR